MRDIVFRAKRKDTGEWAYGTPFPHDYKGLSMFRRHTVDGSLVGENAYLDTLGQYTGLTDKNGKKIFEGDIIVVAGFPESACVVNYGEFMDVNNTDDYYLGWYLRRLSDGIISTVLNGKADGDNHYYVGLSEVIGNVYDNPELLEERSD